MAVNFKSYETRHAKNYSKELLINGFSFLTESGRILDGGAYLRGDFFKNSPSERGGAYLRGELV